MPWSARLSQIRGLAASRFARHSATLATGTLIGNGFAALISPAITRLYGPADLGRLGLYVSFIGVASVATTLRYDMAIVAARTDREAFHLAVGSIALAIPMSILLGAVQYALIITGGLGYGALARSAALITPLSLLLTAWFIVLRQLLVRQERFKAVSRGIVWQSGSRGLTQLGLGFTAPGWIGLVLGDLVGRLGGIVAILFGARNLRADGAALDWNLVGTSFRLHQDYATIAFPSAMLNAIATNLPLPLIVYYFGAASGGQFALVQLVFALPLTLLGTGIGDVFYSRIASYARAGKGNIRTFFLRTTKVLFLLGIGPFVLLALLGPSLLGWIFGHEWRLAGTLAAVMTPWALSQLVVSPVSRIVFVVDGQRLKLWYDAASLILVVATLSLSASLGLSLTASVAWLSVAQVVTYVLYYLLILRAIDVFTRTTIE